LSSYTGSRYSLPSLTAQKGRETLGKVKEVAEELGVAIVFLHHFIKSATSCSRVMDAVGGGYGVYGVARSILVLGWEPTVPQSLLQMFGMVAESDRDEDDDPVGQRIVLAHEKHSTGPEHPSIMYARTSYPHPAAPDDPKQSVAVLSEIRQVAYSAWEVMRAFDWSEGKPAADGQPREQAKQVLLTLLSMVTDGGMRATELEARAVAAGFSKATVQRARKELSDEGMIEKSQTKDASGKTMEWRWSLVIPDAPDDEVTK
jgi:hypothetical protein